MLRIWSSMAVIVGIVVVSSTGGAQVTEWRAAPTTMSGSAPAALVEWDGGVQQSYPGIEAQDTDETNSPG